MAISYNLGYQEGISVHPTRRQIFAGKPYSTFPNIWEWVIYTNTVQVYIYKYSHFEFSRYWLRKDLWAALSQPGWGGALSGCNESASKLKFSTIITDD